MAPQLLECESQALQLPVRERAVLAEHLIASLDDVDNGENELLWLKEAEERYRQYKSGRIMGAPAVEAIRDARASLA